MKFGMVGDPLAVIILVGNDIDAVLSTLEEEIITDDVNRAVVIVIQDVLEEKEVLSDVVVGLIQTLVVTVVRSCTVTVIVSWVIGIALAMPEQSVYACNEFDSYLPGQLEATHRRAPSPSVKPLVLFLEHKQLRSCCEGQIQVGKEIVMKFVRQSWAQLGMTVEKNGGRWIVEGDGPANTYNGNSKDRNTPRKKASSIM